MCMHVYRFLTQGSNCDVPCFRGTNAIGAKRSEFLAILKCQKYTRLLLGKDTDHRNI